MISLRTWWLLTGKSTIYYLLAVVFLATGIWWLTTAQEVLLIIIGLLLGLSSIHFFRLGANIAEPLSEKSFSENTEKFLQRFINIGSGTYNESLNVQGDYVQGDKNVFNNFNFNQDVSGAIDEIKKLLKQIEQQLGSPENAQQKIINDLAILVRENSELRNRLYAWLKLLGFTSISDEVDAAEQIVEVSAGLHHQRPTENIFQLDQRYRRLKFLLKTGQWREADDETIRVIKKLMPNSFSKHGCTSIDVSQISPKQLRTINRLWLEASGGRFGFSVQKQIWLKIQKIYRYENKFNLPDSKYDAFVESVGWSNEKGRIYHVDFDYLITNPKGHLPAKILLWENYNSNSNYCHFSACLFDDFMSREYSNVSFLPAWLRRSLLID